MKLMFPAGKTSVSVDLFIQDSSVSTGAGKTGLTYNAAGLTAYYRRTGGAATAITLATLGSAGAAWSSGGFVEVDATNMPGVYRFDIPDACLAAGVEAVVVLLKGAANMAPCPIEIQIIDPVRGLGSPTALPSAAAGATGGLGTVIRGATAQSGSTSTSIKLDGSASATTGLYIGCVIDLMTGTGQGQTNVITGYDGSTKVATVATTWATVPDNTTVFQIRGQGLQAAQTPANFAAMALDSSGRVQVQSGTGTGQINLASGRIEANTTYWNGSAVATPATAGCPVVTSKVGTGTGEINLSSGAVPVQSGTGTGQINLASGVVASNVQQWASAAVATPDAAGHPKVTVKAGIGTGEISLAGGALALPVPAVAGSVGSVAGNVGGSVLGSVAAAEALGAQAMVDVKATVVAALVTDTYAEPGAVPAATSSLKDKINWVFMVLRNKMLNTGSAQQVRNDGDSGTVGTASLTDSGGTTTRGKWS